ncbi:hypothetical protein AB5I41_02065 [Sphingomonas sp. MMS24-JH45]
MIVFGLAILTFGVSKNFWLSLLSRSPWQEGRTWCRSTSGPR